MEMHHKSKHNSRHGKNYKKRSKRGNIFLFFFKMILKFRPKKIVNHMEYVSINSKANKNPNRRQGISNLANFCLASGYHAAVGGKDWDNGYGCGACVELT